MDLSYTDLQQQFQDLARDFAENELKPHAQEWDQSGKFPRGIAEQIGEIGLTGGTLSEKYGGSELDHVSLILVIEQLARFSPLAATIAGWPSCSLGQGTLKYGSEHLKTTYVKPTAKGEKFGAVAVTEPHSGTDIVRNIKTTAEKDGDEYIINGTKMWISNLHLAEWFVTFATLNPDADPSYKGTIAVIIESDWDGVEIRPEESVMGMRDLRSGEVRFDEVHVPIENRIGDEGAGYKVLMTGTEIGRLACAARALGVINECLRASVNYAKEREVFGEPIGNYQLIQQKIADIKTNYEASRLLTLWLADLKDRGIERTQQEAAIVKRFVTDAAQQAAADAVQLFGANGISEQSTIVGRHYRDSKVLQIYDGTNEIQTVLIGEHELGYR